MAVARTEPVICRRDPHSVDHSDDPMHQDLLVGLRLPGESGAIERAGHSDFGCRQLIEALLRSVQLMNCCLVGPGRRSSQMRVVGAGTSCLQSSQYTPGRITYDRKSNPENGLAGNQATRTGRHWHNIAKTQCGHDHNTEIQHSPTLTTNSGRVALHTG